MNLLAYTGSGCGGVFLCCYTKSANENNVGAFISQTRSHLTSVQQEVVLGSLSLAECFVAFTPWLFPELESMGVTSHSIYAC